MPDIIRILLCGDAMLGRGIDQILPFPGDPILFEPWATSALDYVGLAERANGPIARPVPFAHVWGDALDARADADLFVANLETAVTRAGAAAPKGINYRMTPENLPCLTAAGVDCCVLANNHVLDWGTAGLLDTLDAVSAIGIAHTGAGRDAAEATAPAVLPVAGRGRVLVFAAAAASSGVPAEWAAAAGRPGVAFLADLSPRTVDGLARRIAAAREPGDLVVLSLHWAPNWGYAVTDAERAFAHALIDAARVDVVHGHSSHHPKAIEVHRGKPILYGCGDILNDYEGIGQDDGGGDRGDCRPDLVLLCRVAMHVPERRLAALDLIPFLIRNFRLGRAGPADAD